MPDVSPQDLHKAMFDATAVPPDGDRLFTDHFEYASVVFTSKVRCFALCPLTNTKSHASKGQPHVGRVWSERGCHLY